MCIVCGALQILFFYLIRQCYSDMYKFIYQISLYLFNSTLTKPRKETDGAVPPQATIIFESLFNRSIPHGGILPVAKLTSRQMAVSPRVVACVVNVIMCT